MYRNVSTWLGNNTEDTSRFAAGDTGKIYYVYLKSSCKLKEASIEVVGIV